MLLCDYETCGRREALVIVDHDHLTFFLHSKLGYIVVPTGASQRYSPPVIRAICTHKGKVIDAGALFSFVSLITLFTS